MADREFIQQLLARLDIVEVVERYVKLKKSGQDYSACCPFHNEKTPSFTVSQRKQFFHCFGCGVNGNAIMFLQEHLGLSFPDALENLAKTVGMKVPKWTRKPEELAQFNELYEVLAIANSHFKASLRNHPEAITYLKNRGLSGEVARQYELGYAPPERTGLAQLYPDYQAPNLLTAGLVVEGDNGERRDKFRGRIMFPIHNQQGKVIAYGGRVMDKSEPKYLNSPETPVFHKGRELYGLWQAQKAIRNTNRVLIVEGYMDVVALHQYGIENVVATLGTATTEQHIERLFRLADEVIFSFDGDKAGQRAAWRALENAFPHLQDGKQVRFLFLPEEHDPDSYIRAHGTQNFVAALDEAESLSHYWLRTLIKQVAGESETLASAEQKAALAALAKPYLHSLNATMIRAALVGEVAKASGLAETLFSQDLPEIQAKANSRYETDSAPIGFESEAPTAFMPKPTRRAKVQNAPRHVLSLPAQMLQMLMQNPQLGVTIDPTEVAANSTDALLLKQVLTVIHGTSELPKHAAAVHALLEPALLQSVQAIEHRDIDTGLNEAELSEKWQAASAQLRHQQDRARYEEQLAQGAVDPVLFERLFASKLAKNVAR